MQHKEEITINLGKFRLIKNGDDFIVNTLIEDNAIMFNFETLIYSKNELEATLSCVFLEVGMCEKEFEARINLKSLSSRESFARQLSNSFGKEIPWALLLSHACKIVSDAYKESMLNLAQTADQITTKPTEFLLNPFLEDGASNIIFGKGGTGKTFLALRMAMSLAAGIQFLGEMPLLPQKTLFLDYENTDFTFRWRVDKLAKFCDGFTEEHKKMLYYLPSKGMPLYELRDTINILIKKHNIGFLIIDSVALACGGAPEEAQNAIRYFNAINSFRVTTLSIAHESKADTGKSVFGSVFFMNSARNVWNVQTEQEQEENLIHTALVHRKCNDGKLCAPKGVRIFFSEDGVDINAEFPFRFESELGLKARILSALRENNMTINDLVERFGDKSKEQIKNRLSELKKQNRIENSQNGEWKLISACYSTPKSQNLGYDEPKKTENMEW
jgi:hypothetical protein